MEYPASRDAFGTLEMAGDGAVAHAQHTRGAEHRAGIVDGLATISTGDTLIVYVWYDNEFGYSSQVVRVLETMAGTHPTVVPERVGA